jgi:hypothetical protein
LIAVAKGFAEGRLFSPLTQAVLTCRVMIPEGERRASQHRM